MVKHKVLPRYPWSYKLKWYSFTNLFLRWKNSSAQPLFLNIKLLCRAAELVDLWKGNGKRPGLCKEERSVPKLLLKKWLNYFCFNFWDSREYISPNHHAEKAAQSLRLSSCSLHTVSVGGGNVFWKEPVSFILKIYSQHRLKSNTAHRYFWCALNNKFNWQENELLGNPVSFMHKALLHKDTLITAFLFALWND